MRTLNRRSRAAAITIATTVVIFILVSIMYLQPEWTVLVDAPDAATSIPARKTALAGDAGPAYFVATTGNDSNPGTEEQPFRTLTKGMKTVRAGDILYVRGGTYVERIKLGNPSKGTSETPIVIQAYPGERPVLQGLLWLTAADYWIVDGLRVTWDDATGRPKEHMVKFTNGVGWRLTNSELWGARSYAALLITGSPGPKGYMVDHNVIHDTADMRPAHGNNQDHLIYISADANGDDGTSGVIEHNLLYNSPNGMAIKIGPPDSSTTPRGGVTVRYNTMYNNVGTSQINLTGGASENRIYRNIFQKAKTKYTNVRYFELTGQDNIVSDNLGWETAAMVQAGNPGVVDGGGNKLLEPIFADVADGNFHPLNPAAQNYGHIAGDSELIAQTTATALDTITLLPVIIMP